MTAPLPTEDLVGPRVLAGVQMVNISRLSTHPVPITSRGLITVAGQGPTDSNGAGKSSFIAGLSLLHADDQWRLQSGAQAAAELLFTAELAGQEAMHANADHGYLIGVFVPPECATEAELAAEVLTVWLRINRQSPHVELRWSHTLHLPYGDTENERAGGADALWEALPRSNGRSDLRANRLAKTLYGGAVRCVSFLSTSVRASPTANLLAQPLNELSPERIFDAIGALTGLTRELDQEQKARAEEHEHASTAARARDEYAEWDRRMADLEDGIRSREHARGLLAEARAAWRARSARHLVDGVAEAESIALDLAGNETLRDELESAVDAAQRELGRLSDDKSFKAGIDTRIAGYTKLRQEIEELQRSHDQTVGQLETLTAQQHTLRAQAQAADGLTVDEAQTVRRSAETELERAQRAKGLTASVYADARRALAAAERGQDVADRQIQALRAVDIDAAPLVDVVVLADGQRPVWEPRLLPYRTAVVVRADDTANAAAALAPIPGSLLVRADRAGHPPATAGLPGSADPAYAINAFLTALAERAGDGPGQIDELAGLHAVAGFPEPMTGRAGRISAARTRLAAAADDDQHALLDRQTATQIEAERAEKTATLRSAETALAEARQASAALRATIATAIKAKLKLVSEEFNKIDENYGGYGGGLDFPEPEPPADPQKPWRWSVTPKWRRGEGKPPSSYRLRGNTAQMDDKAVKLVCAAALAGSGDRPLLLILDELGRNLGSAHRRLDGFVSSGAAAVKPRAGCSQGLSSGDKLLPHFR